MSLPGSGTIECKGSAEGSFLKGRSEIWPGPFWALVEFELGSNGDRLQDYIISQKEESKVPGGLTGVPGGGDTGTKEGEGPRGESERQQSVPPGQ